MFVQTEITPNPNSLKFIPGKVVSNQGSFEITKKEEINNELVKDLMSINGVEGIFLGKDFISINKEDKISWDEIKHIVISLINDFYSKGKECVIDKELKEKKENLSQLLIEKIIPISLKIKELLNDHNYLDSILIDGCKKADKIASKKVEKIHEIIGF